MSLTGILLARQKGFLIGWAVGLFLYLFLIGTFYFSVKDEPTYDELWESMPPAFRDAFGGGASITSPGGYLESQATSFLPLVLGAALLAQATRRLSGAEQEGELDLVLNLPIRRSSYLWSHWRAGAITAVGWTLVAMVAAVGGMAIAGVRGLDLLRLAYMVLEILPFLLAVHAGAILAGAATHRRGPATGIGSAVLAAWFLLQIVGSLSDGTAWLRWLSPYALWLRGDPFLIETDPWYVAVCAVIVAVCLPLAARIWERKDLKG